MVVIAATLLRFIVFMPIIVFAEHCGPPPIPHGLRLMDNLSYHQVGRVVFYECDFGFYSDVISGTSICELLPGRNGTKWLTPDITCTEECAVPRVEHGEIVKLFLSYYYRDKLFRKVPVGVRMDDDDEYYLVCDSTYKPMGLNDKLVRVICKDRKWPERPQCVKERSECELLIAPEHGTITYSTADMNKVGGTAHFSCNSGYELRGSTTTKCFEDIGWVFPTPICTKSESLPIADQFMDTVLAEQLGREMIVLKVINPVLLPDFGIPFELNDLPQSGIVEFYGGKLNGLSNVRRLSSCDGPKNNYDGELSVNCSIAFHGMDVIYEAKFPWDQSPRTIHVMAHVNDTILESGISGIPLEKRNVTYIHIKEIGPISVRLSESGYIYKRVYNAIKEQFLDKIKTQLTDIIINKFSVAFTRAVNNCILC